MSWAKAIVFPHRLKAVTLEHSGPPPVGGDELKKQIADSYNAGYQAASDKYNRQILQMRQEMQQHAHGVLTQLEAAFDRLNSDVAAGLPELITCSVYKIIGGDAMEPQVLRARVEEMVTQSCPPQEPVEVKLSPADMAALRLIDENYMQQHPRLKFEIDESLAAGDCVMQTKFGKVDARLKVQLQRMLEELQTV